MISELAESRLIEQLKHDEGFRGDYYVCTGGKTTIGYGRNVDNNPLSFEEETMLWLPCRDFATMPMTKAEAEELLIADVENVEFQVRDKCQFFDELNICRQAVLVNMAFNLGVSGLMKFKKMLSAAKHGEFRKAASEMLDSRWAMQVPNRAMRLAEQMRKGNWEY